MVGHPASRWPHPLQRGLRAARRRAPRRSTASSACPTTTSSTSSATSPPATRPCVFEVRRAAHRAHHLRGPVVPAAGGAGEGRGRGTAPVHQRLALPSQQARPALRGDGGARAGNGPAAALRALGRRPGRARVRRRLLRLQRRRLAGLPGRDVPRSGGHRGVRGRRALRTHRAAARRGGDDLPRARHRRARLRGEEPLPRRAGRAVRRHRFGAGGRRVRRCARPGARARGDDALRLHGRDQRRGCARDGAADAAPVHRNRHPPRVRGVPRAARAGVRRPRRGHHRGEPPGPHPRHAAHGALEQVRLARGVHRQQERDGDGLRHPLRGHGRRLRAASRTW